MDVTKAPPPTDLSLGLGTATNAAAASQNIVAAGASATSSTSTAVSAVADLVDIQPLDVAAALQILIAEVRAELPLPGMSLPGGAPAAPSADVTAMPGVLTLLSSPAQASPVLLRMFLQAVPQEAGHPATWFGTVGQLESTLQSALDRAVSTVEQWHDVPQSVADAARETRGLVMRQLSDEPPGPLWVRPEWMWLSPQMERFRRRRRLARRGLSDPDLWTLPEGDGHDQKRGERKEEP